jgi:hypothetical protein
VTSASGICDAIDHSIASPAVRVLTAHAAERTEHALAVEARRTRSVERQAANQAMHAVINAMSMSRPMPPKAPRCAGMNGAAARSTIGAAPWPYPIQTIENASMPAPIISRSCRLCRRRRRCRSALMPSEFGMPHSGQVEAPGAYPQYQHRSAPSIMTTSRWPCSSATRAFPPRSRCLSPRTAPRSASRCAPRTRTCCSSRTAPPARGCGGAPGRCRTPRPAGPG